jgi:hypothetical protein
MNAPADSVTVLRAHDGPRGPRRLTKAFRIATNGRVSASPYDNAKFFSAEAVRVEGIHPCTGSCSASRATRTPASSAASRWPAPTCRGCGA